MVDINEQNLNINHASESCEDFGDVRDDLTLLGLEMKNEIKSIRNTRPSKHPLTAKVADKNTIERCFNTKPGFSVNKISPIKNKLKKNFKVHKAPDIPWIEDICIDAIQVSTTVSGKPPSAKIEKEKVTKISVNPRVQPFILKGKECDTKIVHSVSVPVLKKDIQFDYYEQPNIAYRDIYDIVVLKDDFNRKAKDTFEKISVPKISEEVLSSSDIDFKETASKNSDPNIFVACHSLKRHAPIKAKKYSAQNLTINTAVLTFKQNDNDNGISPESTSIKIALLNKPVQLPDSPNPVDFDSTGFSNATIKVGKKSQLVLSRFRRSLKVTACRNISHKADYHIYISKHDNTIIEEKPISTEIFDMNNLPHGNFVKLSQPVRIGSYKRIKFKRYAIPKSLNIVDISDAIAQCAVKPEVEINNTAPKIESTVETFYALVEKISQYKKLVDGVIEERKNTSYINSDLVNFKPLTYKKLSRLWESIGGPEAFEADFK